MAAAATVKKSVHLYNIALPLARCRKDAAPSSTSCTLLNRILLAQRDSWG